MKQTAVEWLVEQLDIITRDTNKYDDFKWIFENEIEKAKEMEKQQMIEMHDKGFDSVEQLNDKFAIGFAEWLLIIYNEDIIYDAYSKEELLEIYKKEKGL